MIKKVTAFIQKHHMINSGDHICAGISGGADSVCLFLLLERLRHVMDFSMSVVHVEHGIRGEESLKDMEFVRQLADRYDVPFRCYAFPVEEIAKREGLTVEEAGRKVRYEAFHKEEKLFLSQVKANGGSVKTAVAHHGDDNAETMLFHMCRGSGMDGMAGIRPVRGQIIRPLLCVTRKEIEEFLDAEGQAYCTDVTNTDVAYSRNRIRNRVMPELFMVNKQAVMHMNALAEDVAELADYLTAQVQTIIKDNSIKEQKGISFSTEVLKNYPRVIQHRIMLELTAMVCGSRKDIGREHAFALLEIAKGRVGRRVDLPYGIVAEKSYDKICIFLKERSQKNHTETFKVYGEIPPKATTQRIMPEDGSVSVNDEIGNSAVEDIWEVVTPAGKFRCQIFFLNKKCVKIPQNPYTKWFDYDMIKNRLCFRTRQQGDYLVTDACGHRQKLKAYWINEKVPKAERDQRILLAEDSHILWIVGGRISEYYKITENTKIVLEVQFMEEK